ncbi:hypothetical protein [Streptomyces sp. NPDC002088]|uniref:hypothetical protein n=1 Tax=Streptomyces sp. NPDC002088 TaxID=3154665 RepID=UPI003332995F
MRLSVNCFPLLLPADDNSTVATTILPSEAKAATTAANLAAQTTAATQPMPARPGATQTMPHQLRGNGKQS